MTLAAGAMRGPRGSATQRQRGCPRGRLADETAAPARTHGLQQTRGDPLAAANARRRGDRDGGVGASGGPVQRGLALPGAVDAAFSLAGRGAYLVVAKDVGHDVMMEVPAWTAALVAASLDELAERRWG